MKRERDPTPEEFDKLLTWLDPDRDEAGKRFALIQARLIRIFVSRGCIDAEYLADEVINRVAVRIDEVKRTYSDPLRCCLGFADNVYKEYLRDQRRANIAIEPPRPRLPEELEREDVCLGECLEKLNSADRDLFRRYFQEKGRTRINARKQLAPELGLTANALRIKAHYLRKRLRRCMEACLDEK